MLYNSNNHLRDDSVFGVHVLDALLRRGGDGALVQVWRDFCHLHDAARRRNNNSNKSEGGVGYAAFVQLLCAHGATLDDTQHAAYVCKAFDDDQSGCIRASTFFRHLTSMNARRRDAVLRAWATLTRAHNGHNDDDAVKVATVTADALCDTHARTAASTCEHAALVRCFAPRQQQQRDDDDNNNNNNNNSDDTAVVDQHAFLAFYAGVSRRVVSDEVFVVHLLRTCDADDVTRPVLHRTLHSPHSSRNDNVTMVGTCNSNNDDDSSSCHCCLTPPTRRVADALHHELGRSSRAYNYTHMQRVHAPVDALPPLDRADVMRSTMRCDYAPYTTPDTRTLADPLVTRRGQRV